MTEETIKLIEQVRNGSDRAFSKLYKMFSTSIWITIYNVVKNKDVADDLVSIVFTKAFKKFDTYVEHISFEMWLKTIAVNTSIDYIRRTKNEKLNNYIDDDTVCLQINSLEKSPEDLMIMKQNMDIISKCIPQLRKRYRDLIQARMDGKSYKQISEELAIPEASLKSALSKARNKLKKLINNYQ